MRQRNPCESVRSQLGPFLDEELPTAKAMGVARHLEGCPDCQLERAQIAQLKRELRSLPALSSAATARNRVFTRFRHETDARPSVGLWEQVRELLVRPSVAYTLVTATAVAIALAIPVEPLEASGPVLPDHAELTVLSQRHDLHVARAEGSTPELRRGSPAPQTGTID